MCVCVSVSNCFHVVLQTCAELEQQKKSHALEVEELNVIMQLLNKQRDQLQQQVNFTDIS